MGVYNGSPLARLWLAIVNDCKAKSMKFGKFCFLNTDTSCSRENFPVLFFIIYAHMHEQRMKFNLNLYRPHDVLKRNFLLSFHNLCTYPRADNEISQKLFPRESSRDLYWENKTQKPKRSIIGVIHHCVFHAKTKQLPLKTKGRKLENADEG